MKKAKSASKKSKKAPAARPPRPRVLKRQEQWRVMIRVEAQRIADEEGISKVKAPRLAEAVDISLATFHSVFGDIGPLLDDIYRRAKRKK